MAEMSRLHENLPKMLALAGDRTEEARMELAGMLADVVLDDTVTLNLREQELVNELIDQLMRARTPAMRAQLVKRFADMRRMPRRMAVSLASDTIDIAHDVLLRCVSLTDQDLISVVEAHGHDHAQVIAQRQSISEAVADALVVTGDVRVMQLVAENLGARLSPKAVDVLVDAARFAVELREPIMQRNEMTAEAATRLYWWVAQDMRRYALKRFGITSGQINQALSGTIEQLLSYYELEKGNDEAMLQVANWLAERQAVSIQILPQVLRLGHFRLFNILLSRLTLLELSLVDKIVSETGGRGLAVIARAVGVEKTNFVSIFLLSRGARAGEQIVHPRELSHAIAAYDRMTITLAQNLLHTWKQNPDYLNRRDNDIALEG